MRPNQRIEAIQRIDLEHSVGARRDFSGFQLRVSGAFPGRASGAFSRFFLAAFMETVVSDRLLYEQFQANLVLATLDLDPSKKQFPGRLETLEDSRVVLEHPHAPHAGERIVRGKLHVGAASVRALNGQAHLLHATNSPCHDRGSWFSRHYVVTLVHPKSPFYSISEKWIGRFHPSLNGQNADSGHIYTSFLK